MEEFEFPAISTEKVNAFLIKNNIFIKDNPCISPDYCLNWEKVRLSLEDGKFQVFSKSKFSTAQGEFIHAITVVF